MSEGMTRADRLRMAREVMGYTHREVVAKVAAELACASPENPGEFPHVAARIARTAILVADEVVLAMALPAPGGEG